MKTIKFIATILLFCTFSNITIAQQNNNPVKDKNQWTGTIDQKIWGLMTVWSEVKFGFPYPEKLAQIEWDKKVREFIPRVIESENMEAYYYVLMEFVALLNDSHTSITPPWGHFKPDFDMPPFELRVLNNKFIITRVGESDETASENIYPGLEILEIGNNIPIQKYFQEKVLKYQSQTTKQADEALLGTYLFMGPASEKIKLKVKDFDGSYRNIELSRNSICSNGQPFMYQFLINFFIAKTIETKKLENDILYINIPNFGNEQIATDFVQLIDNLDISGINGMIIDVRYNMGGNSKICNKILGCLLNNEIKSTIMNFPHYSAANKAWGKATEWSKLSHSIKPRDGKKYLGPIVLLLGPTTGSSAEDFVIALKTDQKALTVGEQTSGGGGNGLHSKLPGGADFTVSTFKSTYPDGTEYIGIGIKPDYEIHPTVKDIFEKRDIILEKGIEILKKIELMSS